MKQIIYLLSIITLLTLLYSCGSKPQTARIPAVPYRADTVKITEQIKTEPSTILFSEPIILLPEPQTIELAVQEQEVLSKDLFEASFTELEKMIKGVSEPDFEKAVFLSETPYHGNRYTFKDFQQAIDFHTEWISVLIAANDGSDTMSFDAQVNSKGRFNLADLRYLPAEKKKLYRNALANWAIFTYITDATAILPLFHLPFSYTTHDPFGRKDWAHSQVLGMLKSDNQSGNCFALTALYKILSDRLGSDTRLCTAPQHIYIQHRDPKGDYYNVELATAGHPGDGTIQTLTHSTPEAVMSGIALRSYDKKQSIGLCLVNLAKSYEHTFNTKGDDFLLRCAELALQYDSLNLNALLLKQQVLDERVTSFAIKNNISDIKKLKADPEIAPTVSALEKHLSRLYRLGYRQMPYYMQEIIMTGNYPESFEDKNPSPFTSIQPKEEHRMQYQGLYRGIFPEVFETKELESCGHFTLNTATQTTSAIDISAQTGFLIDPVAFAYDFGARIYDARVGRWLSTDPLQAKYPNLSPYNAFENNPVYFSDPTGMDAEVTIKNNTITISTKIIIFGSGASAERARRMQNNIMGAWAKDGNGKDWTYKDENTGQTYNVKFLVNVEIYDPKNPEKSPGFFSGKNNPFNTSNFIKIVDTEGELGSKGELAERSYVEGGDEGVWYAHSDDEIHEFAHLLGHPDKYTDKKLKRYDKRAVSIPYEGWEYNIMGGYPLGMKSNIDPPLKIEQKNIDIIVKPIIEEYNKANVNSTDEYKTKIDP